MGALQNQHDEQFCLNIIAGMKQREAYMAAFPRAKNWKSITVDSRAYEMAHKPEVEARIQELKDAAADEAILDRTERMILLSDIARDEGARQRDRISAVDILNKMSGDYVKKIETTIHGDVDETAAAVSAILAGGDAP